MHADFVLSSSTLLNSDLEPALTKCYQRCQRSLKSMAAIQAGKYGFDLQTASFYSTKSERTWSWLAEVMYRKVKRQSIDTIVGGIKEIQLELISTLRVASCQVDKNPNQLATWEYRFPLLLQEVKAALEGLQRLRTSYDSAKLEKLDKARDEFEKVVNSTLTDLGEKLARLKISPPKFDVKPAKRPLNVLAPFDNCYSPQQVEFLASFLTNLLKEESYLEGKRVAFKEGEYQLVKSSPDLPWSYAVTPRNNTMLSFHMSPYDAGRGRGSAFKTIKLGYFVEKQEHIVKLTTGFDFDKLAGEHRGIFEMAKKEQGFLKRMQEAPHPNVVRTHEVCWRNKNGKILQIIYQSYGQQGDLFFAWDQIIHDDKKVEKILKGLINGLCHLHSLGIVVNDIKLTNIVLDKDGNPIYIDFNCSHDQNSDWAWGGTLPFTDLVLLRSQSLERKALKAHPSRDIWSLGLVFYLLLYKTQAIPWWPANENFTSVADFEKIIQEKVRLFQEPALNDIWKHACWEMLNVNPQQRPTVEALRQRLQDRPLKR